MSLYIIHAARRTYEADMLTELLLSALFLVFILLAWFKNQAPLPKSYPKGPSGWPLLGNIVQLGSQPHLKLTEWSRQYGAVYSLVMGKRRVVVLNSYKALCEAMVDRKTDFAGRPRDFVSMDLWTKLKDIAFGDYNDLLKVLRKSAHTALRVQGAQNWPEVITTEVDKLIDKLAERSDTVIEPERPLSLVSFNVISSLTQRYTFDEEDQEFIDFLESNRDLCIRIVKISILDYVPWLKPLFKNQISQFKKAAAQRDKYMEKRLQARKEIFNRLHPPCDAIDVMVMAQDKYQRSQTPSSSSEEFDDTVLLQSTMDFFAAGTETIVSSMSWFLVDMMLNPEVQEKIHKEIDYIIGYDRRPDYSDHEKLNYLKAAMYETMRLHTIVPLSVTHRTLCSTSVDGHDIPGDTLVIPNHWAIDHDPDVFKDPYVYRPERFIDPNSGKCVSYSEMNFAPFGLGKRVCLGEMLAREEYFILAVNILHQFEITLPADMESDSIKGHFGLTYTPKPFKIVVTKRGSK